MIAQPFAHGLTVEAQPRQAHHAVNIEPGILAADGVLNSPRNRPGEARSSRQAQERAPGHLTERQSRDEIQEIQQAFDLVPRVAGQPFVRAFSSDGDLVMLAMDFLGQQHEGRAGGINHRTFGGCHQTRIGVENLVSADIDDARPGADVTRHDAGFQGLV